MRQKFAKGNTTDPELVHWRRQTWESLQNNEDEDNSQKIWVYWKLPEAGDSDNFTQGNEVHINIFRLIYQVMFVLRNSQKK